MSAVESVHREVERIVFENHAAIVEMAMDRFISFKARTHIYVALDPLPSLAQPVYSVTGPFEVWRAGRWHPSNDHFAQLTMHLVKVEHATRFILSALGPSKTGGTILVPYDGAGAYVKIGLLYQARHPHRDEETIKLDSVEGELRRRLR